MGRGNGEKTGHCIRSGTSCRLVLGVGIRKEARAVVDLYRLTSVNAGPGGHVLSGSANKCVRVTGVDNQVVNCGRTANANYCDVVYVIVGHRSATSMVVSAAICKSCRASIYVLANE